MGASPAIRSSVAEALSVLPLELGLPLLVDVLDAGDVLDRRPRRARGPAHRVHERLADLVLGGAGSDPPSCRRMGCAAIVSGGRGAPEWPAPSRPIGP